MSMDASEVNARTKRTGPPRLTAGRFGTTLFLLIALPCFFSLIWTLGTPSTDDKGQRYNDLRYDAEVVRDDGQASTIEIQEQPPGPVQFTRSITPADGSPPEIKTFSGFEPMGTDQQGRSLFARCLLGGAISLGVGVCAALMAVFIGVTWGATAGYLGGRIDSFMMRVVDVLYGLPYLLLVVLLSVAVGGVVDRFFQGSVQLPDNVFIFSKNAPLTSLWRGVVFVATFITLGALILAALELLSNAMTLSRSAVWISKGVSIFFFLQALFVLVSGVLIGSIWIGGDMIVNLMVLVVAIGGVSWLTMARVIRGQVLSLRTEPFIEAARAQGMTAARILRVHLLPNLIGPIVVYTTLAVPQAILQESFLSFLGIGVTPPLPSWGQLASEGINELPALASPKLIDEFKWWLLVFPCVLLGLTLLSLNFMGDAMRERFDPRSKKRGA